MSSPPFTAFLLSGATLPSRMSRRTNVASIIVTTLLLAACSAFESSDPVGSISVTVTGAGTPEDAACGGSFSIQNSLRANDFVLSASETSSFPYLQDEEGNEIELCADLEVWTLSETGFLSSKSSSTEISLSERYQLPACGPDGCSVTATLRATESSDGMDAALPSIEFYVCPSWRKYFIKIDNGGAVVEAHSQEQSAGADYCEDWSTDPEASVGPSILLRDLPLDENNQVFSGSATIEGPFTNYGGWNIQKPQAMTVSWHFAPCDGSPPTLKLAANDQNPAQPRYFHKPFKFSSEIEGQCSEPSYEWSFGDGNKSSDSTPSHTYSTPGIYKVELLVRCRNSCPGAQTIEIVAFDAKIATPSGDPLSDPSYENQLVLSQQTLRATASVVPAERLADTRGFLRWQLRSSSSGLTGSWNPSEDVDSSKGTTEESALDLSGVPLRNDDFGLKTLSLSALDPFDGPSEIAQAKFALFFATDEAAHGVPNWFYFWRDALFGGDTSIHYVENLGTNGNAVIPAQVPSMVHWQYGPGLPSKSTINVSKHASGWNDVPNCPGAPISMEGIVLFRNALLHEQFHKRQIAVADAVVTAVSSSFCPSGESPWSNGWSWNLAAHNHWAPGYDGLPGCQGDDDGDGVADNYFCSGPGELGAFDGACDEPLFDAGDPYSAWSLAFGALPPANSVCGSWDSFVEAAARSGALAASGGKDVKTLDWSDAGYQYFASPRFGLK